MSKHLTSETLVADGPEAIKAIETSEGKCRVGGYAIRFSNAQEKDLTGDYFTASTNFGPHAGNGVATLFHHGQPVKGLEMVADVEFGTVKTSRDEIGIFVETVLDMSDKYSAMVAGLCSKGSLRWSSGAASHMTRRGADGEIKRWHPIEFSFTPTPAEPRLPAIRPLKSMLEEGDTPAVDSPVAVEPQKTAPITTPTFMTADEKAAQEKAELEARNSAVKTMTEARRKEDQEILAIGSQFKCSDDALKFIGENKSANDFKTFVLENVAKAKPVDPNAGLVMNGDRRAIKRYSFLKACFEMATGRGLTGLEKEAHEAAAKLCVGREMDAKAFIVPDDILRGDDFKAQIAGTATGGGYTVPTTLGPMIELLRNKTRLLEAGATMLSGLTGDVSLPKHISGATAYWVSETGAITDSESVFGLVKLTPHRLGASIPYSTQFLAQSSIDAESFIRNDAVRVLAIEKDRAGLHGTGANGQPLGIANTPGINATVTYGGAPTWMDVVEHETGIADDNADIDAMAFILGVATVGKWKTTLKDNVAGAGYLISQMGKAMEANGYPVLRTKQVSSAQQSFFGCFSQLIMASWAGLEVIVDPYSLKKSGQVEITFNELCDIVVRQPAAFNVSTDSAAQ